MYRRNIHVVVSQQPGIAGGALGSPNRWRRLKDLYFNRREFRVKKSLLLLLLVLAAVTDGGAQKRIDVPGNLSNERAINLSAIAGEIRYVPLETKEECLLSEELQILWAADYIFVGDQKTQSFYRFGSDGKFLNTIGSRGNGPGEYPGAMFFYVDEKDEKFYVVSVPAQSLYEYTYNGQFLKKISLKASSWTIASLDNNIYHFNNQYNRIKREKNISELYMINKEGRILKQVPTTVTSEKDDMLLMDLPFFYYYNSAIYYKNAVGETVYKLGPDLRMSPHYEIDCGSKSEHSPLDYRSPAKYAEKMGIRHLFENDDIILVTYYYKGELKYLLGNKKDWTFTNVTDAHRKAGFTEDLQGGATFVPIAHIGSHRNCLVSVVQSEDFNDIKGIINKKLNDDDNPVVAIAIMK
ncbi:MAG: 6-bladed beta-propeller [Tannerellaceae bacterium]|nr:6-bladed beta-propeller [Tannerellaceae bacterium]